MRYFVFFISFFHDVYFSCKEIYVKLYITKKINLFAHFYFWLKHFNYCIRQLYHIYFLHFSNQFSDVTKHKNSLKFFTGFIYLNLYYLIHFISLNFSLPNVPKGMLRVESCQLVILYGGVKEPYTRYI